MNRKVISFKNLPSRFPVLSTIVFYLLLDKLNSPGWLWGVVGTVMGLVWIGAIIAIWTQKQVDIFEGK